MLNTRNYITLDGQDLREFGLYISGRGTFDAPPRELNMLDVPGRNGSLISTVTRLQNTSLTYPAFICRNFEQNAAKLRAFLLSHAGYMRLVDTYHPDEYRQAAFRGPLNFTVNAHNNAAQFDLTFEVKPQRWLMSGETTLTWTQGASGSSLTLTNPTRFPALPLLRVYGYGEIMFTDSRLLFSRGNSILIDEPDVEYIDIDFATGEAYYGNENKNQYVAVAGGADFPELNGLDYRSGRNEIRPTYGSSNLTRFDITPRWYTV